MKTITDFLVDITKDDNLAKESLSKLEAASHTELSKWFTNKGYDIHEDECKKLVDNKENLNSSRVGLY